MSFLKIQNLSVEYKMRRETVYAAKNVNIKSVQVSPTYTLSHWTKDFLTD